MSMLVMPRLGETVTEGTVIKWLKNEGERVERDEMIVEISTDKVDTELPSPVAGRVEKILVQAGQDCAVGTELAVIGEDGEGAAPAEAGPGVSKPEAEAGEPETKLTEAPEAPPSAPEAGRPEVKAEAEAAAGPEKLEEAVAAEPKGEAGPGVLSPIVRKLARERGIDLSQVEGTGREGRITKKDVEAYLESAAEAAPEAPPTPAPRAVEEREEVRPLSHIRKLIAERMTRSRQTAAHVTAMIEIDMEKVVRLREARKDAFKRREGFSLTYMPFLCRVVAEALGGWPTLNSSLDGDNLIVKKYINLGIAVSIPDGLIVPVIKDAETLNILGLARAVHDLAERARDGKLTPDEVHGGTFTITNPGSFGSIAQTPIINLPEAAILSFDAIVKKPVVVDDAIAVRHVVTLSLSYDHRINDGAIAAQFLRDVKTKLEAADFDF